MERPSRLPTRALLPDSDGVSSKDGFQQGAIVRFRRGQVHNGNGSLVAGSLPRDQVLDKWLRRRREDMEDLRHGSALEPRDAAGLGGERG